MDYGVIVTIAIAALGFAGTWGSVRQSLKNQKEWLTEFKKDNTEVHRYLNSRIDNETEKRDESIKGLADSVEEHFVRKDHCSVMHRNYPTNGGARTSGV